MPTTLLWFRQDLRLEDNRALATAISRGDAIVPLYIWAPEEEGEWAPGGASRWWLHYALADLDAQLRDRGSQLIIRQGASEAVLAQLARETGARALIWNRRYEPASIERDAAIKRNLAADGLELKSFNSSLLTEPWTVTNKQGGPYKVYSQFFKTCRQSEPETPDAVDLSSLKSPPEWPFTDPLESLELLPKIAWDDGIKQAWQPTRRGALDRLAGFVTQAMSGYKSERNFPSIDGTSRLSPYLHFGQIGPREVYAAIVDKVHQRGEKGAFHFYSEIYWREFAHHVLYHFPETPTKPLRPEFQEFPWSPDEEILRRWRKGETGYPIVDAGMRQLWQTGWMHNRVRMIVGSLLVKHLLQPWQEGARWFWDTLVDADLANNTLGWQWTGGCGADAAPYFRVFNPILQGIKFDGDGAYVRHYCPELARVPDELLHKPWEAPLLVLREAGVELDGNYPAPIVEHEVGRKRALEAFEVLKERREAMPG